MEGFVSPPLRNKAVYFSSLLTSEQKYRPFWERLKRVLVQEKIEFGLIEGSRDIWCRDYMPVQVGEAEFVQFKFFPDYYLDPDFIAKLTIPAEVKPAFQFPCLRNSELVVDGGNISRFGKRAIVTDKVFKENPTLTQHGITKKLMADLMVDRLDVVPRTPYEMTGHVDGMLRLIGENRLLVVDFSQESKSYRARLEKALSNTGCDIEIIPSFLPDQDLSSGNQSAMGCYINYLGIGKTILLPAFNHPKDEQALALMRKFLPNYKILQVDSTEVAMDGGVLNCISWTPNHGDEGFA